jgi:hypothetical protein
MRIIRPNANIGNALAEGLEFFENGRIRSVSPYAVVQTMTLEQVRSFYNAVPFQPFVIHLADGREIPVLSREFIMASPTGRILVVYQPDDTFNWIDLLLVTDLEVRLTTNGAAKRRKR